MARQDENTGFVCLNCGEQVQPLSNGCYRNHCPVCLYSRHVDVRPGDRSSPCGGAMKPVGLTFKRKKGWQIIHCCTRCGNTSTNKIAEGTTQPDDYARLSELQS